MDGAPSTFGEAGVEARLPDSEMLELGGFDERCGGSSPSFSSFSMECKLPLLDVEHVCRQELSTVHCLPPAVAAARIRARARAFTGTSRLAKERRRSSKLPRNRAFSKDLHKTGRHSTEKYFENKRAY